MPTVLIFGGSGKVARLLTKKLIASSFYTVHSIIRNPNQSSDIEALGAIPIVQDVEKVGVEELKTTIEGVGPDVVVWAAGAGGGNPERTKSVDRDGAIKSFDATAAAKNVKRYIIVSALDVRDRSKPDPEWYDEKDLAMSKRVWGAIGPYMECKFAADKDLVTNNGKRGLEYTIVRPGGLNTEEQKGKIEAGKVHLSTTISREDVAEVVLRSIEDPGTIGLAFDVVGGETTIDEALKNVVAGKIDTFEGFY